MLISNLGGVLLMMMSMRLKVAEAQLKQPRRVGHVSALSPFLVHNTMSDERPHKTHHPSQSGKKAEKKATGKKKHNTLNDKVCCPVVCFSHPHARFQAFAPRSGRRAERQGRRAAEKDQTR